MNFNAVAALSASAFVLAACSKQTEAPTHQTSAGEISGFTPASRVRFDGVLLDVSDGGRLGLIELLPAQEKSGTLYAETILIQRQPPGTGVDAVSQLVELDCTSNKYRIVGNLGYRRDGALSFAVPVRTEFSTTSAYQEIYGQFCDDSYSVATVGQFNSISDFLDLFGETREAGRPTLVPRLTDGQNR